MIGHNMVRNSVWVATLTCDMNVINQCCGSVSCSSLLTYAWKNYQWLNHPRDVWYFSLIILKQIKVFRITSHVILLHVLAILRYLSTDTPILLLGILLIAPFTVFLIPFFISRKLDSDSLSMVIVRSYINDMTHFDQHKWPHHPSMLLFCFC